MPECSGGVVIRGLALNAAGTLYVAFGSTQPQSGGVYEVKKSGQWRLLPGTGQIVYPNSIALESHNGSLYVTDMAGAVWKVPVASEPADEPVERHYRTAFKWFESPLLTGFDLGLGMPLGANGIAVADGSVIVAVTFPAKLVRIPIEENGAAGAPETLFSSMAVAFDDIALDVLGNIYAACPGGAIVLRVTPGEPVPAVLTSPDITAPTLTLAFGTGREDRTSIYVGWSAQFGGAGSGITRVETGQIGERLP